MTSLTNLGKDTRWKKGQPSPNPGGRPKTRLLSEALRLKLGEVKADDPQGRTFAEVLAENLIRLACSEGRNAVAAAGEILNRVEGKVHERVEFTDLTNLASKSDDELKYFLELGVWPDEQRDSASVDHQNGSGVELTASTGGQ